MDTGPEGASGMGVGIACFRRKGLVGGEVKEGGGQKKCLGSTVAQRICIFLGAFQYTGKRRDQNFE